MEVKVKDACGERNTESTFVSLLLAFFFPFVDNPLVGDASTLQTPLLVNFPTKVSSLVSHFSFHQLAHSRKEMKK